METIDPAIAPGLSFRGFGEFSTVSRTGLAVANLSSQQTSVTVELRTLTGTISDTTQIDVPPSGHKAFFLDEVPGIRTAAPFQGIVQLSSVNPIAVTLMRTRINPRGDFMIASIPPDNVADVNLGSEALFPLFALGGGAGMEFVMLNSQISGTESGTILFLTSDGHPFSTATP